MTTLAASLEADNRIQVRIVTPANGRRKAAYRSMLACGRWDAAWHHMTVKDAEKALKAGTAHVGFNRDRVVEPYGEPPTTTRYPLDALIARKVAEIEENSEAPATRFDAEAYLLDAIEAVRCGQPGVATDIVDGPRFADVKALLDDLDVPASPYGPGQHARLFRFLCDAAWGRDLPARELPPIDPDDLEDTSECGSSPAPTAATKPRSTTSTPASATNVAARSAGASSSSSVRTTTRRTTDTTEAETCTTPHSGRYSGSSVVGSPLGTPVTSLADAALAALSNAPNTRENESCRKPRSASAKSEADGSPTSSAPMATTSTTRPDRATDRAIRRSHGLGLTAATTGSIASSTPIDAPIGLMIEGSIAYLDELGPDDAIGDFAQYPPSRLPGPKTTYPPTVGCGQENERDVRDAIQAFGAC